MVKKSRVSGISTVVANVPSPDESSQDNNSSISESVSRRLFTSNNQSNNHQSNSATSEDIIVVAGPEQTKEKEDPINDSHLEDVLLSATASNPLSTNRKNVLTKLHSIKDIPIGGIEVRSLKLFCTRVGIQGQRKKTKKDVCDAIVTAKSDPLFVQTKDAVSVAKKEAPVVKRATINRRRLLNVLFGDVVRPKLATLGETLSREELDNGIKQNERFFTLVVEEYNKVGIVSYDKNAFPVISCGKHHVPSQFATIDWKKARDSFKAMCNEYDKCFSNWKKSGFHGDIPTDLHEMTDEASKPFSDFTQNNSSILYMHEFVYSFPDILSKVSGKCSIILFIL